MVILKHNLGSLTFILVLSFSELELTSKSLTPSFYEKYAFWVQKKFQPVTAKYSNWLLYLILFLQRGLSTNNLWGNQLSPLSIGFSPLYESTKSKLHINIYSVLHPGKRASTFSHIDQVVSGFRQKISWHFHTIKSQNINSCI